MEKELKEFFIERRRESAARRAHNRSSSTRLLKVSGVNFASFDHGAHLVVTTEKHVIDFWPGTGKWWVRGYGGVKPVLDGRGVKELLKFINK